MANFWDGKFLIQLLGSTCFSTTTSPAAIVQILNVSFRDALDTERDLLFLFYHLIRFLAQMTRVHAHKLEDKILCVALSRPVFLTFCQGIKRKRRRIISFPDPIRNAGRIRLWIFRPDYHTRRSLSFLWNLGSSPIVPGVSARTQLPKVHIIIF